MATSDLHYAIQWCAEAGIGLTLTAGEIVTLHEELCALNEDKKRLDLIEGMGQVTGLPWVFRDSTTGRGLRLHQCTSKLDGAGHWSTNIREAIDRGTARVGR